MENERYFECRSCGAVVQGWHAANGYGRGQESGCTGSQNEIVEIKRDDNDIVVIEDLGQQ